MIMCDEIAELMREATDTSRAIIITDSTGKRLNAFRLSAVNLDGIMDMMWKDDLGTYSNDRYISDVIYTTVNKYHNTVAIGKDD